MASDRIERTDDGIVVTFTGEYDTIRAWSQVRENLGLNPAGPDRVEGIELIEEDGLYRDEDDEYPYGYERAALLFEDEDALKRASDRLYSKATEMFEYGIAKDAEKVQRFAGRIPSTHDVPDPEGEANA